MKQKLAQLEKDLRIDGSVALWFSGGKDSRLLLDVMSRTDTDFSILRFDDGLSNEQKRHIYDQAAKYSVPLFSYAPVRGRLVGDSQNISLVLDYAVTIKGQTLSVCKDVIEGTKCAFDIPLKFSDRPTPPVIFSTHILGSKKTDRHYLFGKQPPIKAQKTNGVKILLPLWNWMDAEVKEGLAYLGLDTEEWPEYLDSGNLSCCSNCLRGKRAFCPKVGEEIEPVNWNPKQNLQEWREYVSAKT